MTKEHVLGAWQDGNVLAVALLCERKPFASCTVCLPAIYANIVRQSMFMAELCHGQPAVQASSDAHCFVGKM